MVVSATKEIQYDLAPGVCRGTAVRTFELRPSRCRCRFCRVCKRHQALLLRARLEQVLLTYREILMVTLTVDPNLFFGSKEAFFYVTENRCIRKLVQQVKRKSTFYTDRYFWMLEFTQTGAPHVHVVLDASHIPLDIVQEKWDRFRPPDAGVPEIDRPEFGSTHVRGSPAGDTREQAAARIAAYLTDTDAYIPAWVMTLGASRRIRTFGTSWRFWPSKQAVFRRKSSSPRRSRSAPRSYAERAQACGSTSHLLAIQEEMDRTTGELKTKRRYVAELQADLRSAEPADARTREAARPIQIRAETAEQAIDKVERTLGHAAPIVRLAKRQRAA